MILSQQQLRRQQQQIMLSQIQKEDENDRNQPLIPKNAWPSVQQCDRP